MNDSYSGKNGKVKVMYVRSEDNSDSRKDNDSGRNNNGRGRNNDRRRNSDSHKNDKRPFGKGREQGDRRRSPERSERSERSGDSSPWRTISRPEGEPLKADHGGISGKSYIDPEQLRRQRLEETRIYGENACQAMFQNRPDAIVRAWFVQSVTPRFREALKWMAANRKAYHVVDDQELAKASGTEHHGGVCFLIKKRNGLDAKTYLQQAPAKDCVLALENVGNPHNLGAIMRSCAHFGVQGVILQDTTMLESGAAVRTAEGGAEHIKGIDADGFTDTLNTFRNEGYTIVTTSSHKGSTKLAQTTLPEKMVLVLGQESDGLSDSTWEDGDIRLSIGGTGQVESLNVSVATGIMLAEWWRQNKS
ncbi:tRNA/rRNA methyltransferase [Xenorhabdus szentirmaii]|uniref:tRNA/rRNA methyltransferase n=1 Tax=Xenorhabdus szentirmaii TaxID=290112 RepID=A0AAW3YVT4_9GAMM|nr:MULTISPECIES: tRNA/rRNA methyltransferase [Xenorhabdus]MBD2780166.1 tRNA/rRNA methyltransferase [Xenorhabdus sp. 38]MBD2793681.1 tRNA/rRNA methyltransferase [Xenorhabdus sp. CUL]MBD2802095.1 tRNA/rRNA methyltransferase [Xenorhabdus sp. M]MBD2806470.1 tRNA/rRNA methyltransferase [Xenorhabdus sp. ZM]MBD2826545.1 tRNA/rRNA methyltransferase [Xenorhabdus sp. 5]